ncbi:hypothetical protein [Absidia glauca]|uniref:Uncharacterized protein n=1 Tax=Absidia glauca TaxID=4829 RepID=A0A163LZS9_ABSGL|nr:hypothetical protein [Absidia glauca]
MNGLWHLRWTRKLDLSAIRTMDSEHDVQDLLIRTSPTVREDSGRYKSEPMTKAKDVGFQLRKGIQGSVESNGTTARGCGETVIRASLDLKSKRNQGHYSDHAQAWWWAWLLCIGWKNETVSQGQD